MAPPSKRKALTIPPIAPEHLIDDDLSYDDLLDRKTYLQDQLQAIALPTPPTAANRRRKQTSADSNSNSNSTSTIIPMIEKTSDVHRDFLLKEMQWLATDFMAERKRHKAASRKLANGLMSHIQSAATRRQRELDQAVAKRKATAHRIGAKVSRWWTAMDRVVTYQQKAAADQERRAAMNQQLVKLVQQTERYTQSLAHTAETSSSMVTIEQALANASAMRRTKRKIRDYGRLQLAPEDTELYGESTTEDSGSDASYSATDDEEDDETTLRQAEAEETRLRLHKENATFVADPDELRKLQEESELPIEKVLERLAEEAEEVATEKEEDEPGGGEEIQVQPRALKRTKRQRQVVRFSPASDPGNDADDDGDASDVEDFVDDQEDEFVGEEPEPDDETTMAQEEALPTELSPAQEIQLLQQESEVSVEELRKKYAGILGGNEDAENDDEDKKVSVNEDLDDGDMQEADEEFQPSGDTVDDETTMIAEENLGRDMSYQDEIALLQRESEMSVEELRKMYGGTSDGDGEDMENVKEEDAPGKEYHSLTSTLAHRDDEEEDEFKPAAGDGVDDETTMEAEEKLGRDMSYKDEIELLKRESEMSFEELRQMYSGPLDNKSTIEGDGQSQSQPHDDERENKEYHSLAGNLSRETDGAEEEFVPESQDVVDDETTIAAEERLGRDMTYQEELSLLKRENEMSVEELREMYTRMERDDEAKGASADDDDSVSLRNMNAEGGDGKAPGDGNAGAYMESADDAENDLSSENESDSNSGRKRRRRDSNSGDGKAKHARLEHDSEGQASDAGKRAMDALEASAELARRTRASRPFLLAPWVKLREYQQIGLNWLVSMQTRRLNGILADEMGLGKTLQTISLLSYLASYKGIWGPHLIVVPTSVILNWETELKRFCPALKVLCYYGSAKRRKELRTGWTKSNWYHVVITSYQLAVQDAFAFKRKRWYYLVLDEAQNIKNFQSQRWQTLINFNTQRRLLLTEFSYWFANPMNSMIDGTSAQNDSVVNRLHGIIRPFVLRRLKKDVETQMPGKFEHIIKCQLSRRQMFIYEEFMARSSTRQALKKGGNFMGMMNVLMQLRKVCNHPDLFEPRSVVTPFALDAISLPIPSCVHNVSKGISAFETVSTSISSPLWSGSEGQPSVHAALKHDDVESAQLRQLEKSLDVRLEDIDDPLNQEAIPPPLLEVNRKVCSNKRENRVSSMRFLNSLNSRRCKAYPFAFPERLLESVQVKGASSKLWEANDMSTPAHLLSMRRDQLERADNVDYLIKKFVFCVPKAGGRRPFLEVNDTSGDKEIKSFNELLLEPLEECLRPFKRAHARLTSFFPDKKLIQFDSGKLQTLAELLRELKRGGHRALIFTQMSKMLDILEAFLNLNGHTYLRLDGSTGVDQRQRMMDRFNNDSKIFCFILSTRSGGMGVNLTGADTVIFFDNDWNPAMDAQAQDRAHRIGQTREVHIFRLVTEHTIEENILMKAQQKRNLDVLVMDQGNFNASRLFSHAKDAKATATTDEVKDVYTKGGLRAILGVTAEAEEDEKTSEEAEEEKDSSKMENAMASLEDVDDVVALRGAQKEAADELKEFDESIEYAKESDDVEDDSDAKKNKKPKKGSKNEAGDSTSQDEKSDGKTEVQDMEKEFAAWQSKVGMDAAAIEASLSPMERYGLRFRTEVDPFYSMFAAMEERRKLDAQEEADDAMNIDEIEREKAVEEERAMDDGDLLATFPEPEDLVRQRALYLREKSRLKANKKLRKLTGQDWEPRIDGVSQNPFWYNIDTGEAVWDRPVVLLDLEAYALAQEKRWMALPKEPLIHIMSYLSPFPDRMNCARMCRQWHGAASDVSFVRHVYPVEMGAYTRDEEKMHPNHYRDISHALKFSQPGDSIELSDGHYWANEDVIVDVPVRFVGDEHNPSNVVIEMGGSFIWKARGGYCEGITFRRPKLTSGEHLKKEILYLEPSSRVHIVESVLDNEGSKANVVSARGGTGTWRNVVIRNGTGGLVLDQSSRFHLSECSIRKNQTVGIACRTGSTIELHGCVFQGNGESAVSLTGQSRGILKRCHFRNTGSLLCKETGSTTSCSENTVAPGTVSSLPPGFKIPKDDSSS